MLAFAVRAWAVGGLGEIQVPQSPQVRPSRMGAVW